MDFPTALTAVLAGGRARRSAWLSGSFIVDVPASEFTVGADRPMGRAVPDLVGKQVGYNAHIDVFVDGELVPWTANQTDLHATDWETC